VPASIIEMEATLADPVTGLTPAPAGGQPPFSFAAAPTAPGFDVADLLPTAAAERLRQLRQHSLDQHALTVPFEQVREASMARQEAQNAHRRLVSHQQEGGFNLKPEHPSVMQALKTLERAEGELARLQARQAERSAAWNAAGRVLANVETWLRDGRPSGTVLEDWDGPEPQLLKGEKGLLDAVENRRRRVRELKATLHTIESAPFPSSWAKQRTRAQIEVLSTQGVPSVSNLVERAGSVEFQTQRLQSEVFAEQRAIGFAEVADAVALIAWLHKDALIAALDREIASEADDKAALSQTDRELRSAEIMGDLLAVERDESVLVWRAMDENLPASHRPDCSPQAVLQVQLRTVPRAIDGPTTSPLAYDVVRPGGR
jgi:hypothetical protein